MMMSQEQIIGTMAAIGGAIENGAEIQTIVAVGAGLSCRDVILNFSAEDSKPILEAALAVLQSKVAA